MATVPRTQHALLNAVDHLGRPIDPCVLTVAQEIAPQALAYTENFIGDPCVAMNLLEEAAAAVSEVVRAKEAAQIPPIRDIRAYLYRTFLRRIADERRNEARLQAALEDDLRLDETMSVGARVETKLVLKQVLSMCDRKTRSIIWGRIEGRSWDDISYDVVMSNHAARLHYSKALRAIRHALKTDLSQYIERIMVAEREQKKKSRLIFLWEIITAFLCFRALRLRDILAVRLRVTDHEKDDILAEVDRMFA
ncbi:MAG: RNA polymerase sigma factor [Candidatus Dormibacteria bacterium]